MLLSQNSNYRKIKLSKPALLLSSLIYIFNEELKVTANSGTVVYINQFILFYKTHNCPSESLQEVNLYDLPVQEVSSLYGLHNYLHPCSLHLVAKG